MGPQEGIRQDFERRLIVKHAAWFTAGKKFRYFVIAEIYETAYGPKWAARIESRCAPGHPNPKIYHINFFKSERSAIKWANEMKPKVKAQIRSYYAK